MGIGKDLFWQWLHLSPYLMDQLSGQWLMLGFPHPEEEVLLSVLLRCEWIIRFRCTSATPQSLICSVKDVAQQLGFLFVL